MSKQPVKIALTGGIASGKSLAAQYLKTRGIPVIDADDVVHALLKEDEALKAQISDTFGGEVFTFEDEIDRSALGRLVFGDMEKRKWLESWIHPKVRERIASFFEGHAGKTLAIALIPLVFESDLVRLYDEIWLIDTTRDLQLKRLVEQRGMQPEDAIARLDSQLSADEKRRMTEALPNGYIIDNTATPEAMYSQLDALLDKAGSLTV